jgi:glycosyltransferase involved in cell wall biosynthesis
MKLQELPADERRILHVFASFGYGGVPIRICDVMNALPSGYRHTVIALDGCFDARRRLKPSVAAEYRQLKLPKYNLVRSALLLRRLVRDVSPDLMLTYNWGAIEPALVNRFLAACPQVHFESGFGAEEGNGQLGRRNFVRRIALGGVRKVVVPSATLMKIATEAWSVAPGKLLQIPNGVDWERYSGEPGQRRTDFFFSADPAVTVIGTVAPLRPEKNVGRLLRAFAAMPERIRCRLVVAGDGVEKEKLCRLASELQIESQTDFLGHVEEVPSVLRNLDVFALSSDTEQMPNSLLQAMAAGRPVTAVDVGDVAQIVAPENRNLVVPRDEKGALTRALSQLVADAARREQLGRLNQLRARADYSLEGMVAAYSALLGAG